MHARTYTHKHKQTHSNTHVDTHIHNSTNDIRSTLRISFKIWLKAFSFDVKAEFFKQNLLIQDCYWRTR